MERTPGSENKTTLSEALARIAVVEQQIRMGPVDSEVDALNDIRNELRSGDIEPHEAVARAETIERERSSHYR
ncbi:hypothetical protein CL652_01930 [bacterium]|nr:hypothetical protein [bacterium]|tara:strand:+ start:11513 stop:11731 length:219 start_codon:yes stop_codon:yes gene_type:complete